MFNPILARQPYVRQAIQDYRARFPQHAALAGGTRIAKAEDLALSGYVMRDGCTFQIQSQSIALGAYFVNDQAQCTCPDYPRAHQNGGTCKHVLASMFALDAENRAHSWEETKHEAEIQDAYFLTHEIEQPFEQMQEVEA